MLIALVACSFCAFLAQRLWRKGTPTAAGELMNGTSAFALVTLPGLVGLQMLWQTTIGLSDGSSLAIIQSLGWLTVLAGFYLLTRTALQSATDVRMLIVVLVMVGAAEAAYGLLNLLAGNEHILFYRRTIHFDSATGTFYSRNQFAFLLELLLPLGVALASVAALPTNAVEPERGQETERQAQRVLVYTAVVTMALALLFSRSRMGICSLTAAGVTLLVANSVLTPRSRPVSERRRRFLVPALAALVVASFALVIGIEPVFERFFNVKQDLEQGRWPLWQATMSMALAKPFLGHGWGTYEGLVSAYRSRPTGLFFDHAHNEYLEIFAETGIVGVILVCWLVSLFVRRLARTLTMPLSPRQRALVLATGIGISSVLLHSVADFGLRAPAIAFAFVLLAALFSRITEDPMLLDPGFDPAAAPEPRTRRRRRRHAE